MKLSVRLSSALFLLISILSLVACGGGGSGKGGGNKGGSDGGPNTSAGGQTNPAFPTATPANVNGGYKGSLYVRYSDGLGRLDADTGIMEFLYNSHEIVWASKDGEILSTVSLDYYDGNFVRVYDSRGILQYTFKFNGSPTGVPKVSPDGKVIALGYNISRGSRGVALFSPNGTVIRDFVDDENGYLNGYDWTNAGNLILIQGNSFSEVDFGPDKDYASGEPVVFASTTGTPLNLELSPDETRLVFDRIADDGFRHIFVMSKDGSELQQVTATPGEAEYDPTWSPDGGAIAFRHGRDWLGCALGYVGGICYGSCPTLHAVAANTSMANVATGNPVFFVREVQDNTYYTMCAFGPPTWTETPALEPYESGTAMEGEGANRGLTGKLYYAFTQTDFLSLDLVTGVEQALNTIRSRYITNPHVRLNSDEVVFERASHQLPGLADNDQIIIQNFAAQEIASFYIEDDFTAAGPELSPDGKWVAVEWSPLSRNSPSDGPVVTLFDREGTFYNDSRFVNYGDYEWASDGSLLLSRFHRLYQTRALNVSDVTEIASFPATIFNIAVSPDNTRVAFSMANHLWVSDINGENLTQLTTSGGSEWNPEWSPDGRHIAFTHLKNGTDIHGAWVVPADAQRAYVGEAGKVPSSAASVRGGSGFIAVSGPLNWTE